MTCQQIILLLLIIIILLCITNVSEYFSYDDSETTPMPRYLPKYTSQERPYVSQYIADPEPECGNHYGFYDVTKPKQVGKRIVNAKFIDLDTVYDAYCSPYVLNDKVTVCSVYDESGEQLFYGFSNPRC